MSAFWLFHHKIFVKVCYFKQCTGHKLIKIRTLFLGNLIFFIFSHQTYSKYTMWFVWLCIYIYICRNIYAYTYMHIYAYTYIHTNYVHKHEQVHVFNTYIHSTYICKYIYIYTYFICCLCPSARMELHESIFVSLGQ